MSSTGERETDEKTITAMKACIDHARALLDSARAVQAANHPNVAYHLAALALEEVGRRELIGVQSLAARRPESPAWISKHTQDHVKKLFWCFFGGAFAYQQLTGKALEELSGMATFIHSTRLAGLYVEHDDDGLSVPEEAITAEQSSELIDLAAARLAMAESGKVRDHIPDHEVELQNWFLDTSDDREKRRMIFSRGSMAKLAELKDARAWVAWLKEQFDRADAESRAAVEEELRRSRNLPTEGKKDKWRLRVRVISASHSLRGKELTKWNKRVDWIKLAIAKKNELIFEMILKDNVPVEALWFFGWGLARHFVVALNIGTMGFWWWRMPEQISRYYDSLRDLEKNMEVRVERSPALKVDWGSNRVLTAEDLDRVAACFTALPGPYERDKHKAFNHYIGGLTFLSLNDIHWQCESAVFGNFFECLKALMCENDDWKEGTSFRDSMLHFLDDMFPNMDGRDQFAELCGRFESRNVEGAAVTLKDATFMKLFCDAYFMRQLKRRNTRLSHLQEEPTAGSSLGAPTAPHLSPG
ncbi:MAG TPA: AbiV family abortive infection protein [Terriglobia bacterium]|nr:AbiV family abortive infection protein [Terriglobia bacterium]